MTARFILLSCAILSGLIGSASAETLSFPEHNFSLEIPDGWSRTDAPSPAIAAAKNAEGQKIIVIVAAAVSKNERDTAVQSMASAAKKASKAKGWKIGAERRIVVKGIEFDTYTYDIPGGITGMSWMTSAGSEVYAFECIHKAGDASSDAEFKSIIESYRLLSPASVNMSSDDTNSVAYRIGRLVGGPCACIFVLGLLVLAGFGIFWLIRRKKAAPR
jgi:predicted Zn-dependent protease